MISGIMFAVNLIFFRAMEVEDQFNCSKSDLKWFYIYIVLLTHYLYKLLLFFSYLIYFNESFYCFSFKLWIIDSSSCSIYFDSSWKCGLLHVLRKIQLNISWEIANQLMLNLASWNNEVKISQWRTCCIKAHFKPSFPTIYKIPVLQEWILTCSKDSDLLGTYQ